MVAAAHDLLAALDDDGRERISFAVDAVEWQTWANPEFMQFDTGLRLDLQPAEVREKALALMRASLSPEGYELAHAMMLINGFLGEVVDLETGAQRVQLQHRPLRRARPARPLGLAAVRPPLRGQLPRRRGPDGASSPVFLGAEPDEIDAGPHAGLRRRLRRPHHAGHRR